MSSNIGTLHRISVGPLSMVQYGFQMKRATGIWMVNVLDSSMEKGNDLIILFFSRMSHATINGIERTVIRIPISQEELMRRIDLIPGMTHAEIEPRLTMIGIVSVDGTPPKIDWNKDDKTELEKFLAIYEEDKK